MTTDEQEIWAQMQKGIDRHWAQIARMGKGDHIGFISGRYLRGSFLRVCEGSQMELVSPSGYWEATVKDGLVNVPRKIRPG